MDSKPRPPFASTRDELECCTCICRNQPHRSLSTCKPRELSFSHCAPAASQGDVQPPDADAAPASGAPPEPPHGPRHHPQHHGQVRGASRGPRWPGRHRHRVRHRQHGWHPLPFHRPPEGTQHQGKHPQVGRGGRAIAVGAVFSSRRADMASAPRNRTQARHRPRSLRGLQESALCSWC